MAVVERGPAKAELVLSEDERATLERWARRPKSAQRLALRCRIVLACAEGVSNMEVAGRLGVTRSTVGKWRSRFVAARLEGLSDDPRLGVPRSISDEKVEEVVVKTLEEMPKDATHWSTRSLAKKVGISPASVGRIWGAFGLRPHGAARRSALDGSAVRRKSQRRGRPVPRPARACRRRPAVDEKSQIQALKPLPAGAADAAVGP